MFDGDKVTKSEFERTCEALKRNEAELLQLKNILAFSQSNPNDWEAKYKYLLTSHEVDIWTLKEVRATLKQSQQDLKMTLSELNNSQKELSHSQTNLLSHRSSW